MKTENLTKAYQTLALLMGDLLQAHNDAADRGDQFAEIVVLALVAQAKSIQQPLEQALVAAGGDL
jgi:hypothetical protein